MGVGASDDSKPLRRGDLLRRLPLVALGVRRQLV
jgi:hypothetical protein